MSAVGGEHGSARIGEVLRQAIDEEREHLRLVRRWVASSWSRAAVGELSSSFAARAEQRERTVERPRVERRTHPATRAPPGHAPQGHDEEEEGEPHAHGVEGHGQARQEEDRPAMRSGGQAPASCSSLTLRR